MSNPPDAITNAFGGRTVLCALCAMILLPMVSHADEFDPEEFSCRASAVFVELVGAEPFIANEQTVPCTDDLTGLLPPGALDLGVVSATALSAVTEFGEGSGPGTVADSSSSTAHVRIVDSMGAEIVEAVILQADASVEATQQGDCKLRSESFVGSAIIQGQVIDVDGEPREVPLGPVGTLFLNWTESEDRDGDGFDDKVTQRALFLDSDIIGDVVVSEAMADFEAADACAPGQDDKTGNREGFMTGGGRFSDDDTGERVTHGLRLECSVEDGPNRLQVNWGNGNSFHLLEMTEAVCSDDPAIDPGQPRAEFDTHDGQGTGRLRSGGSTDDQGTAEWTFTDAGEPGFEDAASIVIRDSEGTVVLGASGSLVRGNHQAHMRPSKADGND